MKWLKVLLSPSPSSKMAEKEENKEHHIEGKRDEEEDGYK